MSELDSVEIIKKNVELQDYSVKLTKKVENLQAAVDEFKIICENYEVVKKDNKRLLIAFLITLVTAIAEAFVIIL